MVEAGKTALSDLWMFVEFILPLYTTPLERIEDMTKVRIYCISFKGLVFKNWQRAQEHEHP